MRTPLFHASAPKRTVDVLLNADLCTRAKSLGIDISRVAEDALARAYARARATQIADEMRRDVEAIRAYEETHGSFADHARTNFESGS